MTRRLTAGSDLSPASIRRFGITMIAASQNGLVVPMPSTPLLQQLVRPPKRASFRPVRRSLIVELDAAEPESLNDMHTSFPEDGVAPRLIDALPPAVSTGASASRFHWRSSKGVASPTAAPDVPREEPPLALLVPNLFIGKERFEL